MTIKNLKRISILLVMSMLAVFMASCSQSPAADEPDPVQEEVEEVEEVEVEEEVEALEDVIVVVDHLGRQIEFDQPAKSIVSGYYIPTSMLLALGLKDQIVGIEGKADMRPIYEIAAPEILDLPSVGTMKEFDLEGAVALNPDLIVMSVRLEEAVESMEKLGIKVIAVNPEDTQLLSEALMMIAKATGTQENAEKLIAYNDEKTKMIEELVKDQEVKTVYLGGNSSFLSTASSKMYQHDLIETAGGNNVAGEIDDTYWAEISYEQLIAYNPDVIVSVPGSSYTKEEIMEDTKLQGIKAVDNGSVYFMPSAFENWDSPIPAGILGKLWLTSVLHEDLYPFEEFQDDAFEFYKEFFGVEIDKDQITK